MNRDIKFRVWDTVQKRFAKQSFYLSNEGLMLADLDPYGMQMDGSKTIGVKQQYVFAGFSTGKKDRAGELIYEGDIVRNVGIGNHLIEWDDEGYWMCKSLLPNDCHYNGRALFLMDEFQTIEIIGNIYKTPELLEASKQDR